MPLKIMCAGCSKDEREPAETSVKAALGMAAGSWTVSLVKIGRQWSVTVDGPEVKHKTMVVPEGGIRQAILEITRPAPAATPPAPRAPAPPTFGAPGATAPRAPTPVPAFSPPTPPAARPTPTSRAPLPPTRTAPAPAPRPAPSPAPSAPRTEPRRPADRAPSPPRTPPASPRPSAHHAKSGERQDRYECQFCGGAFHVIYEASPGASQETVAVACPHCWKNSHVMVAEEAAISRDYRSEKA